MHIHVKNRTAYELDTFKVVELHKTMNLILKRKEEKKLKLLLTNILHAVSNNHLPLLSTTLTL